MIEFDASKVVVEVNGVEVIGFGGVRPTMPTDTEILDWLIDNDATVNYIDDGIWEINYYDKGYCSSSGTTPRQAIAAAMAEEAK